MRPLLQLISLRRLFGAPLRTALSVVGIALGVAVLVAVTLVNESVLRSVTRGVEAVAGRADLEVSAGAAGIEEGALDRVRAVPGVAHAAPAIEVTANVLAPAAVAGEGLQMAAARRRGCREQLKRSGAGRCRFAWKARLVAQAKPSAASSWSRTHRSSVASTPVRPRAARTTRSRSVCRRTLRSPMTIWRPGVGGARQVVLHCGRRVTA